MITPKRAHPTRAEETTAYEMVTLRDQGRCVYCGAGNVTRDHRQPRSLGGRTVVENLHLLCGSGTTGCHGKKTTQPLWGLREGLTVPSWADPASWPGRRLQNGTLTWVLYSPDVGYFDHPTGYRTLTRVEVSQLTDGLLEG